MSKIYLLMILILVIVVSTIKRRETYSAAMNNSPPLRASTPGAGASLNSTPQSEKTNSLFCMDVIEQEAPKKFANFQKKGAEDVMSGSSELIHIINNNLAEIPNADEPEVYGVGTCVLSASTLDLFNGKVTLEDDGDFTYTCKINDKISVPSNISTANDEAVRPYIYDGCILDPKKDNFETIIAELYKAKDAEFIAEYQAKVQHYKTLMEDYKRLLSANQNAMKTNTIKRSELNALISRNKDLVKRRNDLQSLVNKRSTDYSNNYSIKLSKEAELEMLRNQTDRPFPASIYVCYDANHLGYVLKYGRGALARWPSAVNNTSSVEAIGSGSPQLTSTDNLYHVRFIRNWSSHFRIPRLDWNFLSGNGGFTIVVVARLSDNASHWERVFDFGNGMPNNNILLARNWFNNAACVATYNGGSGGPHPVVWGKTDTTWRVYTYRVENIGNRSNQKLYINTKQYTNEGWVNLPNRVTQINYIGRSNWWWDGMLEGDIREMTIYNRHFSEADTQHIIKHMMLKWRIPRTENTDKF
jgi:hypothetical protein